SFTTMTSKLGYSSLSKLSKHSERVRLPLNVQTMTETFGQQRSFAKGTLVNASRTVPRAGLGRQSRAVMPNSQSSTSAPALCHSSVHENIKAPAQPGAKVLRSCH